MLPRVFELFTQVDRTLEQSQGGLGIGLTLVKRLVEMHGGRSRPTARAGPGKRVHRAVARRRAAGAPGRTEARRAKGRRRPARHRILVVDDNDDAAAAWP